MRILPKDEAFDVICFIAFSKGIEEKDIPDFAQGIDSVLVDEGDWIVLIRGEDREETDIHYNEIVNWTFRGRSFPKYDFIFNEYPRLFEFIEERLNIPSLYSIRVRRDGADWKIHMGGHTFSDSDYVPELGGYVLGLVSTPIHLAETEWNERKKQMFESWMQK